MPDPKLQAEAQALIDSGDLEPNDIAALVADMAAEGVQVKAPAQAAPASGPSYQQASPELQDAPPMAGALVHGDGASGDDAEAILQAELSNHSPNLEGKSHTADVRYFKPPVYEGEGEAAMGGYANPPYLHYEPTVEQVLKTREQYRDSVAESQLADYDKDTTDIAEHGKNAKAYGVFADKQWKEVHDEFRRHRQPVQRAAFASPGDASSGALSGKGYRLGVNRLVGNIFGPALSGADDVAALGMGKQALATTARHAMSAESGADPEPVKALRRRGVLGTIGDEQDQYREANPYAHAIGGLASLALPSTPAVWLAKGAGKAVGAVKGALPWFAKAAAPAVLSAAPAAGMATMGEAAATGALAGRGYGAATQAIDSAGQAARGEEVDPLTTGSDQDAILGAALGMGGKAVGDFARGQQARLRADPRIGRTVQDFEAGGNKLGTLSHELSPRAEKLVGKAAQGQEVSSTEFIPAPEATAASRTEVLEPGAAPDAIAEQTMPGLRLRSGETGLARRDSGLAVRPSDALARRDQLGAPAAEPLSAEAGADAEPLRLGAGEPDLGHIPVPERAGTTRTTKARVTMEPDELAMQELAPKAATVAKARQQRTVEAIHNETERGYATAQGRRARSTKALADEMHAIAQEKANTPFANDKLFSDTYKKMHQVRVEPAGSPASNTAKGLGGRVVRGAELPAELENSLRMEMATRHGFDPAQAQEMPVEVVHAPREMNAKEFDDATREIDRRVRYESKTNGSVDPAWERLGAAIRRQRAQNYGPQWEAMKQRHHEALDAIDADHSALGVRGAREIDPANYDQQNAMKRALEQHGTHGNLEQTKRQRAMLLEDPGATRALEDYVGLRARKELSLKPGAEAHGLMGHTSRAVLGPAGLRLDPTFERLNKLGLEPRAAGAPQLVMPGTLNALLRRFGPGDGERP